MREDIKLLQELNDLAARETAERLRLAAAMAALMGEAAKPLGRPPRCANSDRHTEAPTAAYALPCPRA